MEPLTTEITRRVHHAKKTLHTDDRLIDWYVREILGMGGSTVAYHDDPGFFENMTGDQHWEATRTACIGVSGGEGDEHPVNGQVAKTGESASSLWLKKLGVEDPALWRLQEYCRRNDTGGYHEGQSVFEKHFDLASIIQALNYHHPRATEEEIQLVADCIFTALYMRDQNYLNAVEEFSKGAYVARITPGVYVAAIRSANPAMEWVMRSHFRVALSIMQWPTGHMRITPRQKIVSRWVMDEVCGFVRLFEARVKQIAVPEDRTVLQQDGSIPGLPEWFYLNGVLHNGYPTRPKTPASCLPLKMVFEGLTEVITLLTQGGA